MFTAFIKFPKPVWFRTVALTLALTVPASELYAYTPPSPDIHAPALSTAIPLDKISVPADIGSIQEVHLAEPRDGRARQVIFIQDAHGVLSAQENIAKLVKYFHTKYDIRFLTVEGAAGEQPMRQARNYSDSEIRREVAREFLAGQALTGDEYYIIAENPPLTMYGAERMLHYYLNRDQFFKARAKGKKLAPALKKLKQTIRNLESEVYAKDLREFMRRLRQVEAHPRLLGEHIKYLVEEWSTRVSKGRETIENRYPELSAVASEDAAEIKAEALYAEMRAMEKEVKQVLIRSEEERRLVRLAYLVQLLDDLFKLALTPDRYNALMAARPELSRDAFKNELDTFGKSAEWAESFDEIFGALKPFLTFYRQAKARDRDIAVNTARIMKKQNAATGLTIAGGFHSPGLTDYWKRENISYVVVQPKIGAHSDDEVEGYQIKAVRAARRQLAASNTALAERGGFGPFALWRFDRAEAFDERYQELVSLRRRRPSSQTQPVELHDESGIPVKTRSNVNNLTAAAGFGSPVRVNLDDINMLAFSEVAARLGFQGEEADRFVSRLQTFSEMLGNNGIDIEFVFDYVVRALTESMAGQMSDWFDYMSALGTIPDPVQLTRIEDKVKRLSIVDQNGRPAQWEAFRGAMSGLMQILKTPEAFRSEGPGMLERFFKDIGRYVLTSEDSADALKPGMVLTEDGRDRWSGWMMEVYRLYEDRRKFTFDYDPDSRGWSTHGVMDRNWFLSVRAQSSGFGTVQKDEAGSNVDRYYADLQVVDLGYTRTLAALLGSGKFWSVRYDAKKRQFNYASLTLGGQTVLSIGSDDSDVLRRINRAVALLFESEEEDPIEDGTQLIFADGLRAAMNKHAQELHAFRRMSRANRGAKPYKGATGPDPDKPGEIGALTFGYRYDLLNPVYYFDGDGANDVLRIADSLAEAVSERALVRDGLDVNEKSTEGIRDRLYNSTQGKIMRLARAAYEKVQFANTDKVRSDLLIPTLSGPKRNAFIESLILSTARRAGGKSDQTVTAALRLLRNVMAGPELEARRLVGWANVMEAFRNRISDLIHLALSPSADPKARLETIKLLEAFGRNGMDINRHVAQFKAYRPQELTPDTMDAALQEMTLRMFRMAVEHINATYENVIEDGDGKDRKLKHSIFYSANSRFVGMVKDLAVDALKHSRRGAVLAEALEIFPPFFLYAGNVPDHPTDDKEHDYHKFPDPVEILLESRSMYIRLRPRLERYVRSDRHPKLTAASFSTLLRFFRYTPEDRVRFDKLAYDYIFRPKKNGRSPPKRAMSQWIDGSKSLLNDNLPVFMEILSDSGRTARFLNFLSILRMDYPYEQTISSPLTPIAWAKKHHAIFTLDGVKKLHIVPTSGSFRRYIVYSEDESGERFAIMLKMPGEEENRDFIRRTHVTVAEKLINRYPDNPMVAEPLFFLGFKGRFDLFALTRAPMMFDDPLMGLVGFRYKEGKRLEHAIQHMNDRSSYLKRVAKANGLTLAQLLARIWRDTLTLALRIHRLGYQANTEDRGRDMHTENFEVLLDGSLQSVADFGAFEHRGKSLSIRAKFEETQSLLLRPAYSSGAEIAMTSMWRKIGSLKRYDSILDGAMKGVLEDIDDPKERRNVAKDAVEELRWSLSGIVDDRTLRAFGERWRNAGFGTDKEEVPAEVLHMDLAERAASKVIAESTDLVGEQSGFDLNYGLLVGRFYERLYGAVKRNRETFWAVAKTLQLVYDGADPRDDVYSKDPVRKLLVFASQVSQAAVEDLLEKLSKNEHVENPLHVTRRSMLGLLLWGAGKMAVSGPLGLGDLASWVSAEAARQGELRKFIEGFRQGVPDFVQFDSIKAGGHRVLTIAGFVAPRHGPQALASQYVFNDIMFRKHDLLVPEMERLARRYPDYFLRLWDEARRRDAEKRKKGQPASPQNEFASLVKSMFTDEHRPVDMPGELRSLLSGWDQVKHNAGRFATSLSKRMAEEVMRRNTEQNTRLIQHQGGDDAFADDGTQQMRIMLSREELEIEAAIRALRENLKRIARVDRIMGSLNLHKLETISRADRELYAKWDEIESEAAVLKKRLDEIASLREALSLSDETPARPEADETGTNAAGLIVLGAAAGLGYHAAQAFGSIRNRRAGFGAADEPFNVLRLIFDDSGNAYPPTFLLFLIVFVIVIASVRPANRNKPRTVVATDAAGARNRAAVLDILTKMLIPQPSEGITADALTKAVHTFNELPDVKKRALNRAIARAIVDGEKTAGEQTRNFASADLLSSVKAGGVNLVGPVDVTLIWNSDAQGVLILEDMNVEAGGDAINTAKAVTQQGKNFGLVAVSAMETGVLNQAWRQKFANKHLAPYFVPIGDHDVRVNVRHVIDGQTYLMRSYGEPFPDVEEAARAVIEKVRRMFENAPKMQWVAMTAGGGGQFDGVPWMYGAIVDLAHEHGVQVLIDFKNTSTESEIKAVLEGVKKRDRPLDIITPNVDEFILILEHLNLVPKGTLPETALDAATIKKHARTLIDKYHLQGVLLTRDKHGLTLVLNDGRVITDSSLPVEVVTDTGAGDAVKAGLMLALAEGRSWEDAVAQANLFGAATVALPGTQVATPEMIEAVRNIYGFGSEETVFERIKTEALRGKGMHAAINNLPDEWNDPNITVYHKQLKSYGGIGVGLTQEGGWDLRIARNDGWTILFVWDKDAERFSASGWRGERKETYLELGGVRNDPMYTIDHQSVTQTLRIVFNQEIADLLRSKLPDPFFDSASGEDSDQILRRRVMSASNWFDINAIPKGMPRAFITLNTPPWIYSAESTGVEKRLHVDAQVGATESMRVRYDINGSWKIKYALESELPQEAAELTLEWDRKSGAFKLDRQGLVAFEQGRTTTKEVLAYGDVKEDPLIIFPHDRDRLAVVLDDSLAERMNFDSDLVDKGLEVNDYQGSILLQIRSRTEWETQHGPIDSGFGAAEVNQPGSIVDGTAVIDTGIKTAKVIEDVRAAVAGDDFAPSPPNRESEAPERLALFVEEIGFDKVARAAETNQFQHMVSSLSFAVLQAEKQTEESVRRAVALREALLEAAGEKSKLRIAIVYGTALKEEIRERLLASRVILFGNRRRASRYDIPIDEETSLIWLDIARYLDMRSEFSAAA